MHFIRTSKFVMALSNLSKRKVKGNLCSDDVENVIKKQEFKPSKTTTLRAHSVHFIPFPTSA